MEKKRRARINVSLEQLKSLLEKNYSQNIRKRKLEKADILELTVKYMKTLQNSVQGTPLFRSAEYQAGFRNCLNGVSQFLMKSEESGHTAHISLSQDLARALPAVSASCFSTKDSSSCTAQLPAHHGQKRPLHSLHTGTPAQYSKRRTLHPKSSDCHVTSDSSSGRSIIHSYDLMGSNGNRDISQSLWRPW
ncbi:transcription factor HES-3 [Rhinophrynus dorsalis]